MISPAARLFSFCVSCIQRPRHRSSPHVVKPRRIRRRVAAPAALLHHLYYLLKNIIDKVPHLSSGRAATEGGSRGQWVAATTQYQAPCATPSNCRHSACMSAILVMPIWTFRCLPYCPLLRQRIKFSSDHLDSVLDFGPFLRCWEERK
jgi:hypothetical protein